MKRLLLIPLLSLASCKSGNLLENDGKQPQVSVFAANVAAVGGELHLGTHRVGLALTYRNVPDPAAPPQVKTEIPITYPTNDK